MTDPLKSILEIADVLSKLLVPLLGWVSMELRNINSRLAKIEERHSRFDVWIDAHDKQDDERHKGVSDRLREVELRPRVR